jgi:ABC-type glycerol-3-phosphate transport system permease component
MNHEDTKDTKRHRGLLGVLRVFVVKNIRFALLFLALVFALAPVYWMFTISLKSEVDQFASPPPWFIFTPTLEHYYDAFLTRGFGQYLLTSAIVAVTSTAFALVIGTLAAYASMDDCLYGFFQRECFRQS